MSASLQLLASIAVAGLTLTLALAEREAGDLKPLTDRQGNFRILMPEHSTKSIRTVETKAGRIRETSYIGRLIASGIAYGVSFADFPEPAPNVAEAEDLLDRGRDACVAAVEGRLLAETRFRFEGSPARDFSYVSAQDAKGDQIIAHVRMIFISTRLYQVMIVADSRRAPPQETVDQFIDSFDLLQK